MGKIKFETYDADDDDVIYNDDSGYDYADGATGRVEHDDAEYDYTDGVIDRISYKHERSEAKKDVNKGRKAQES
jgi:hypothetical protein